MVEAILILPGFKGLKRGIVAALLLTAFRLLYPYQYYFCILLYY